MKMNGHTILVTGGGSGIGRALAEAFHAHGNTVVVAGRTRASLDAVTAANPGMRSAVLDIGDAASIAAFAKRAAADFPELDVLVNNAGIMKPEKLTADDADAAIAEETIATNLLGTIRLTTALLPALRERPAATIVVNTSGLAFVPLAMTPTYNATKAGLHSYAQSLRYQLRETGVEVLELAPPYVQTELMGEHQASDPDAMPLADFIAEVMALFAQEPTPSEILVERVKPLRFAGGDDAERYAKTFGGLNAAFA